MATVYVPSQSVARRLQRICIAIDADYVTASRSDQLEQGLGVATAAQRPVHVSASLISHKPFHHLIEHDRHMIGGTSGVYWL